MSFGTSHPQYISHSSAFPQWTLWTSTFPGRIMCSAVCRKPLKRIICWVNPDFAAWGGCCTGECRARKSDWPERIVPRAEWWAFNPRLMQWKSLTLIAVIDRRKFGICFIIAGVTAHSVEVYKMEITKIELKILIKEFLTASNRVLRADFEIYCSELRKFLSSVSSGHPGCR